MSAAGLYDSVHPDDFAAWFRTFHEPLWGRCTTGLAALSAGRRFVLIDTNEEYCRAAVERLREEPANTG